MGVDVHAEHGAERDGAPAGAEDVDCGGIVQGPDGARGTGLGESAVLRLDGEARVAELRGELTRTRSSSRAAYAVRSRARPRSASAVARKVRAWS
ncbi:MAG: hypothetical protein AVDCRST_MAG66-1607 [uncultured Pseudonocardia sp.]|uniref:Uncharacterized protein n=1 Tax=uncultured Pseudonocardia sp. TaxID=211455 RepID=A0A6J4P3W9_9PSEU|nr:MAG: hypothetical protein AVDCRST_MAG66-1607 [uncultured Pseudonocardia sp.]